MLRVSCYTLREFMLMIKLSRFGKKKQPTFRLLVVEKAKDPWGDFLENLGNYNPRTKKAELKVERIKYWLSVGAQPTDSVHNFLVTQSIISEKKRSITKLTGRRREKLGMNKKEEPTKATEAKPAEEKK